MDAECARMNCEERATVLMAYDPRNARAWLRDLTDGHPSLGLALCSWHAASTSVPMGWECIDERRGMRFGLDDIDEPEAGFLFTEEPLTTRRLLTEPTAPDRDVDRLVGGSSLLETGSPSLPSVESRSTRAEDLETADPVSAEPYVTRFDDRGRFDDETSTPVPTYESVTEAPAEPVVLDDVAPTWADDETDSLTSDSLVADSLTSDAGESLVEESTVDDESADEASFDLPDPEPIRILDREPGRAPSVSYFDDDGYNEPIAIPLDEIDGIELGFEPLMPGDELNDLKLEAAERFTVIEPVADDEFDDFEPVPEPIVSDDGAADSVGPMAQPTLAVDALAEDEYLLQPDIESSFESGAAEALPHLVAVDSTTSAPRPSDPPVEAEPESEPMAIDDLEPEADHRPRGFSDAVLGAPASDEPAIDDAPIWADDEPSWRTDPETVPEGPVRDAGDSNVDDDFEVPRLFDDIGYAEIDDADAAARVEPPSDDEEINPDDELSFDDIFPSMVNRPPAQTQPASQPSQTPRPDPGHGDPQASITQAKLPTIGTAPAAPERAIERDQGPPEQLRPPVARTHRSEPSFENLVFQEDSNEVAASPASRSPETASPSPAEAPMQPSAAPLPRLFAKNHVEVRQLSVDASTPLLNRAFGFVPRD